jgi:tartrate/fumarate subfamily iron-sulfur-dependent hydro-lyase beta chain
MSKYIRIPISVEEITNLKVGESALLSGVIVTGRDAVHKWIHDTFISQKKQATPEDMTVLARLKPILDGGLIYHCGPVVTGSETGKYRFTAAGPTTSMREEPYQADVMRFFNLRGVIGKGGMGIKTLQACYELPAVYFNLTGGAAALIAECVSEVLGVFKLDFGVPEAIWVINIKDLPVVVTMDAHCNSLHTSVRERSNEVLKRLMLK